MATTENRVWTTGTFAREIERSVETVRRLEARGVLSPQRDATGRRLFTTKDLEAFRKYRAERSE